MGQASSQVQPATDPPAAEKPGATNTTANNAPRHRKRKMRVPRRKSMEKVTSEAYEDEYGMAASSQLIAENEPVQSPRPLEEVINQRKRRRSSTTQEKARKKAKSSIVTAPQENNDLFTRTHEGAEDVGSSNEAQSQEDAPRSPLDEYELPSPLFRLDDAPCSPVLTQGSNSRINSDDEDVASFLRDFEEEEMTTYPFDMQQEQVAEREDAGSIIRSSPPIHPQDDAFLGDSGQHTLAPASSIDFEAFDKYCAAHEFGAANILDDVSGQTPGHVEPDLTATMGHANGRRDTVADSDGDIVPHRAGQLKRANPRKRKRPEVEDCYSLSDEQSDQVLPGLEDAQQQSPCSTHEKEDARSQGPFTKAEISTLEDFRDNYCEQLQVSAWQFNDLVQAAVRERPKAKAMWQGMYEVLPHRKKTAIQRFSRRRFHNFEVRGAWTKEDDEELARAVEAKGKSWVAIGQMMERSQEDVRDRWRNYHVNSEFRNKEQWTDLEVRKLATAVQECMQIMKAAKRQAKLEKYDGRKANDAESESDNEEITSRLINWQIVSDRMGGTRSRLQCSFKWGKLKKKEQEQFTKQMKEVQKDLDDSDREIAPRKKNSWRQRKARHRVQEMRPGDLYDFLQAVSICQATHEDNIPWQSLGNDEFRKRWSTADRKAAWQMFKGSVLGADGFSYHEIVNHLLANLLTYEGHRLDERWDPEVDGYGEVVSTSTEQLPESRMLTSISQAPPPETTIEVVSERKRRRQIKRLQRQMQKRKAEQAQRGPTEWRSKVKSSHVVPASDDADDS